MTAAIAALTKSLARPVTRGLLPEAHAHAAIAAALARAEREGRLEGAGCLADQIGFWAFSFGQYLRNEQIRALQASSAIERSVRKLIDRRKPSAVLYAEAHNVNADFDFLLTESQVADIVAEQMTWAIRAAQKGRINGR